MKLLQIDRDALLTPLQAVTGIVRYEDGTPARGAFLQLIRTKEKSGGTWVLPIIVPNGAIVFGGTDSAGSKLVEYHAPKTDANGKFKQNLGVGRWQIRGYQSRDDWRHEDDWAKHIESSRDAVAWWRWAVDVVPGSGANWELVLTERDAKCPAHAVIQKTAASSLICKSTIKPASIAQPVAQ